MTYRGKVKDNVVVLEPGIHLPDGAEVRVEISDGPSVSADPDPLARMGELAVATGIRDLATNIDHYLYGHPKAGDAAG